MKEITAPAEPTPAGGLARSSRHGSHRTKTTASSRNSNPYINFDSRGVLPFAELGASYSYTNSVAPYSSLSTTANGCVDRARCALGNLDRTVSEPRIP